MRILQYVTVIVGYLLLISASHVIKTTPLNEAPALTTTTVNAPHSRKAHKLNFVQRFILKAYLKRHKLEDLNQADRLASSSLVLGISACGVLLLGLFVPYIILLTLPAGIAAMITGGAAIRKKTSLEGKARTGKGLGLGALIAFGLLILLAAILLTAFVYSI